MAYEQKYAIVTPRKDGAADTAPKADAPAANTGASAGNRSERGSYWNTPGHASGEYFVPQVEGAQRVTSGGEGGMDTYEPGDVGDYAFLNPDGKGGWKAHGSPGDYGVEGEFDNTEGTLAGYGHAPIGNANVLGGDVGQYRGPIKGRFYKNAPEEKAFVIEPEETFMEAFSGGRGKPWWGIGPATMAGGVAGIAAGAAAGAAGSMGTSAIGGTAGDAALGGSLTAAGGTVAPLTGAIPTGLKYLGGAILNGMQEKPKGLLGAATEPPPSGAPPTGGVANFEGLRPSENTTLYTKDGKPVFLPSGLLGSAMNP